VDTGGLVAFDETVGYDIVRVGGLIGHAGNIIEEMTEALRP
jgi:uncharacterized protein (AIM24 family)